MIIIFLPVCSSAPAQQEQLKYKSYLYRLAEGKHQVILSHQLNELYPVRRFDEWDYHEFRKWQCHPYRPVVQFRIVCHIASNDIFVNPAIFMEMLNKRIEDVADLIDLSRRTPHQNFVATRNDFTFRNADARDWMLRFSTPRKSMSEILSSVTVFPSSLWYFLIYLYYVRW